MEKKIIVADNDMINRKLLCKIISQSYNVIEVQNGQEALEVMRTNQIGAIIFSLIMPILDGYGLLEIMKSDEELNKIPRIVITASQPDRTEERALELGAWDFITKPYNPKVIMFRLNNALDRSQYTAFEQLAYLSRFDELTDIYNKNYFFSETKKLITSYPDITFAFIVFDINKFQLVNSFFGNSMGDMILQGIADIMKKIYREIGPICTFGRIEADIFAYCVPYYHDRIIKAINQANNMIKKINCDYNLYLHFGIYVINDTQMDIERIYDFATLAVKKIKKNLLATYCFYDDEMSKKIIREQEIINVMDQALDEEQFVVYFQPKCNLETGVAEGAEALVRWIKDGKIVPPNEFIPLFETNGFIARLDNYVWEKTCQLIRKWIDEGLNVLPISVNVSRVDVYSPRFVENFCDLVDKYNIPHEYLCLELTESAFVDNIDLMVRVMGALQKKGFIIMMDDFGSGYSSLNILKDILVDVIKIDLHFLEDDKGTGRGKNILSSVVRLAKWLNIPIIAEGVETEEQVNFLRSINGEWGQGYYYAKPMPLEEYEKILRESKPVTKLIRNRDNDFVDFWTNKIDVNFLDDILQPSAIFECSTNLIELIRCNEGFKEMFSDKINNIGDLVSDEHFIVVQNSFNYTAISKETCDVEFIYEKKFILCKLKYLTRISDKTLIYASFLDVTDQRVVDTFIKRIRANMTENRSLKILIVDDLEINRKVLKNIFQYDYTVSLASDGKEALDIITKNNYHFDLILLDLYMPVMSGCEFLNIRNGNKKLKNIPVVIITAENNEDVQTNILSLGVNDYIVSPFVKDVVKKRISNVLESSERFKTVLDEYNNVLTKSKIDPLTGIYNRGSAKTLIDQILHDSNEVHGMLILDIDEFKLINDTLGHMEGDKKLVLFSKIISEFFRQTDIVFRLGGDEFGVFMNKIKPTKSFFNKFKELHKIMKTIDITFSSGLVVSSEQDTFDDLYQKGDEALYRAKKNGRNQCFIYEGENYEKNIK